jgi:hypothetical protein
LIRAYGDVEASICGIMTALYDWQQHY